MTMQTIEWAGDVASGAQAPAQSTAFARVDVFTDAEAVVATWRELEASAPCSVYQTRAFVLPWSATLGRRAGFRPIFVLASDRDGRPTALLALGIVRRGPVRVATWLGGRDSNFNMPLLRCPSNWTRSELIRFFKAAAEACGSMRPHVFELPNQPFSWQHCANPLVELARGTSPSAAFGTALHDRPSDFFGAKLSKETRKKLRKKEAKLAAVGSLTHRVVSDRDERRSVLDAFFAQKLARFRARGIDSDFGEPAMRAFIEAASAPDGTGIELHALCIDERVVAVYGGAAHGGQWSGMFNSFDAADEEIAKASPGDLLLMRIIERCCAAGLTRFDLGIGEARYKETFCGETIPLFDAFVPVTALGRTYAAFGMARQHVKRAIKRDPRLFALLARLRALRSRRP